MNGLIGGVARGAADIGRIARIGGMMRSFGRIQQVVLGMAIRRIWCLPQHAGKVGGDEQKSKSWLLRWSSKSLTGPPTNASS